MGRPWAGNRAVQVAMVRSIVFMTGWTYLVICEQVPYNRTAVLVVFRYQKVPKKLQGTAWYREKMVPR